MPHQGDAIEPGSATAARRRSIAIWIWSSLVIADSVLLTRRVSGDFTGGPALLAILSTVIIAIASWAAWVFFAVSLTPSLTHTSKDSTSRFIPKGIAVLIVVIWGASVSAGVSPIMLAILAAILVSQGIVVVLSEQDVPRRRLTRHNTVIDPGLQTHPEQPGLCPSSSQTSCDVAEAEPARHDFNSVPINASAHDSDDGKEVTLEPLPATANLFTANAGDNESDQEEFEELSDENQTLWLSRRVTDEGELIEGWVRIHFAEGQRETVVHVAFCPPLAGSPELETEDLEGVGLEIRVAAVFPFGARLSVRRSGSLEDRHSDRVGFVAQSQANRRAA